MGQDRTPPPGQEHGPGRTAADNRLFVNAVLFVCRTGVPWADLPARFGKPDAVRKRHDRWCANGIWQKAAAATGEADPEEVQLDPTTIKAHPVVSTGRRLRAEKEDADARRCLGRSRGGLSTKAHAAVDRRGRLLRLALTPGPKGDCPQAPGLLEGLPRGGVEHVIADAAYDSDALRERVRGLGARCCIKPNPARKNKSRCDRERYKHRGVIERFFCRARRCRRVTTRYEQKAANFAGFVYPAAFVTAED